MTTAGTQDCLEKAAKTCVECGLCSQVQRECGESPMTLGTMAKKLLRVQEDAELEGRALKPMDLPDDVYEFARSCLTCGRCTARCPVNIRAAKVVMAARAVVADAMPQISAEYRRYRCDLEDSMFNRMRYVQGVEYEEYLPRGKFSPKVVMAARKQPRTLYFQGCTLGNNFPSLNKAVEATLYEQGLVDATTSFCCGRPLMLAGLDQQYEDYCAQLCRRLKAGNVTRIVTACPNCYYSLRPMLEQAGIADRIEVKFLTEVLVEAGYRFTPSEKYPYTVVCFHDSCPDRHDGTIANSLRTLFENVEIVETPHNRSTSVCCGSGGFASVFSQVCPQYAYSTGAGEFMNSGAQCLISSCANCASTYGGAGNIDSKHYLELIFDEPMDMDACNTAFAQLWDPSDPLYIESYAEDNPFFLD